MGRLDGKVAVVTGGSNGIGRACAIRFAEEGADVVVADLLDGSGTVAEIEGLGRKAVFVEADATSAAHNDAIMARAVTELGRLDTVVTAAGVAFAGYRSGEIDPSRMATATPDRASQFVELVPDEFRQVLEVNLTGTLLAVQAAARVMRSQGTGGSIITIASIAAKHPEFGVSYSVSKAGVWMLTKEAAVHLVSAGIRVNAIGPGFIETNMTAMISPEMRTALLAGVPMRRMGTPREVANTALFLASDESSYFTGEILHPDGGFYTE